MLRSGFRSLASIAALGVVTLAAEIMPPSVALAQQASASEAGFGLPLLIVVVASPFLIRALRRKRRENEALRRQNEALQVAGTEIDSQAAILRVKRIQTVQRDDYGTVSLEKWEKEKAYFFETRILPLLRDKGLLAGIPGDVIPKIGSMIDEAALRPGPSPDIEARFISNPEVFDPRMDPVDYEKYCALQLEKSGWKTRLTAVTGDQGADVIANRDGKALVVQCKLYGSPVGNDAVQQVIAARQFQAADLAAVVSNQPFTRSANQLAGVSNVRLLHHEQLASFTG